MAHQADRRIGQNVVAVGCRVEIIPEEKVVRVDQDLVDGEALRRMGDISERIRRRCGNNTTQEVERVELVDRESSVRVKIFEHRDAGGEIAVEDQGCRRIGQRRGGR